MAVLRAAGAEARLEEFPAGTPTAKDAAEAVGCELADIVKSLVFRCDGRAVVVLVPGDRRADTEKVAGAVGCSDLRIARGRRSRTRPDSLRGASRRSRCRAWTPSSSTGRSLARQLVWVGAGSDRHMAGLEPSELVRLSRATAMDAVGGAA